MDYGWFAYQCNTGETLFFYNKFSGEYRWLSCTCTQKANAALCKNENAIETVTKKESQISARSIGIGTDPSLSTLPRAKEFRTQGTQTDVRDILSSTIPISNDDICRKKADLLNCNLSNNHLPVNVNELPDKRKLINAEEEVRNDTRNTDQRKNNKVQLFPCCSCSKAFTSFTFLRKHMKCHPTVNNQELQKTRLDSNYLDPSINSESENLSHQQKADTASEKTAESPSLEASLFGFPSNNSLQCFQCNMTFTSSKALDDHFGAWHYDETHCESCQRTFQCKKTFKSHLITSHFGEKHHCSHCDKKFPVRLGLLRHQRCSHNQFWNEDLQKQLKKLEKTNPDKEITEENSKQNEVTENKLAFKCDNCNTIFGLYSELVEHQKNCEKIQPQKNQQRQDSVPVLHDKPYWCSKCNHSYESYRGLVRHKKTKRHKDNVKNAKESTKEKIAIPCNSNYCCQNCNSSFKDYGSLVKHKKLNNCFENTTHFENNIFKCMLCTDIFFSVTAIAKHVAGHIHPDKDGLYPCNLCTKQFNDQDALERHLYYHLQVHNCSRCNQSFEKWDQLSEHNRNVHCENNNFACSVCNKKFMQLAALTSHYKTHNKANGSNCSFCGKFFHLIKNLKKHIKKCRYKKTTIKTSQEKESIKEGFTSSNIVANIKQEMPKGQSSDNEAPLAEIHNQSLHYNGIISSASPKEEKNEETPICLNLRLRKIGLQPNNTQEIPLDIKEKKFQCFKCKKFFTSKYLLIKHQQELQHGTRSKTLAKRYKCRICKRAFNSYSVFYQHQLQHNSRKSYKCRRCGTCFSTAKLLSQHQCAIATEKKIKYPCKLCGAVYSNGISLSNHLRAHKFKLKHECKCCSKVFENERRFKKHKRTEEHRHNVLKITKKTVSGKKIYECCRCGKFLSSRSRLLTHKVSCCNKEYSSKQKNVHCFTCNNSFQTFSKFQEHFAATHGKGAACWLCHKSFSCYSNLNRHVRDAHKNEKQFFCNWCSKEFSSVDGYATHSGNSTPTSRHVCKFCQSDFYLCSILTDHIKTCH